MNQIQNNDCGIAVFKEFLTATLTNDEKLIENFYYDKLSGTCYQIGNETSAVEEFNANIGKRFNLPPVISQYTVKGKFFRKQLITCLKYKEKSIAYQYRLHWDSSLVEAIQLSKIIVNDVELRFDKYACDCCGFFFFGLPPLEWQKLEQEFGKEKVHQYFVPIQNEFAPDEFEVVILDETI